MDSVAVKIRQSVSYFFTRRKNRRMGIRSAGHRLGRKKPIARERERPRCENKRTAAEDYPA